MSLLSRFRASMVIDYEKWHDGIGYDLDALAAMSPDELGQAESAILSKGVTDWRDLEALDQIGTSSAFEAIVKARCSDDPELRIRAHQCGPQPEAKDREAAILHGLRKGEPYSGYFQATALAAEFPSPKVIEALLHIARHEPGTKAYHAAAVLDFLSGGASSPDGIENREFLLKFSEAPSEERNRAMEELASRFSERPSF